jgi:hypothetical protein
MFRIIALSLLLSSSVLAQDRPTNGVAYSVKEMSSIQYRCSMEGSDILKCDMTQLAVRKKALGKT